MKKTILLLIFLPLFFCSCSNDDEVKEDYRELDYFEGLVDGNEVLVGTRLEPSSSFGVMLYQHKANGYLCEGLEIGMSLIEEEQMSMHILLKSLKEIEYHLVHHLDNSSVIIYLSKGGVNYDYKEESPIVFSVDDVRYFSTSDMPAVSGRIDGVFYNKDSSDSIVIRNGAFNVQKTPNKYLKVHG